MIDVIDMQFEQQTSNLTLLPPNIYYLLWYLHCTCFFLTERNIMSVSGVPGHEIVVFTTSYSNHFLDN